MTEGVALAVVSTIWSATGVLATASRVAVISFGIAAALSGVIACLWLWQKQAGRSGPRGLWAIALALGMIIAGVATASGGIAHTPQPPPVAKEQDIARGNGYDLDEDGTKDIYRTGKTAAADQIQSFVTGSRPISVEKEGFDCTRNSTSSNGNIKITQLIVGNQICLFNAKVWFRMIVLGLPEPGHDILTVSVTIQR